MKKKRLATLNASENKTWVKAFEHYKGIGLRDSRADERAWEETQSQHPRLLKYDGCKP
jgi:hypothetical protein